MLNTLPQPDADIASFVRVTRAEDGIIDIFIADNYREDFKVQHFVNLVQGAFLGRTRWASLSLDEITNVAPPHRVMPRHTASTSSVY